MTKDASLAALNVRNVQSFCRQYYLSQESCCIALINNLFVTYHKAIIHCVVFRRSSAGWCVLNCLTITQLQELEFQEDTPSWYGFRITLLLVICVCVLCLFTPSTSSTGSRTVCTFVISSFFTFRRASLSIDFNYELQMYK